MSELQIIEQREVLGKDFRIYGDYENPLFLAKDVAEWIEYSESNVSKLVDLVADNEKVRNNVTSLGGQQEAWFLTEDGLYEVLMQSRKPIAKQFKSQVKEILRSIRKHGAYMTPATLDEMLLNPDAMIKVLTVLKDEQAKNRALLVENNQQKLIIGELKPAKDYVDLILSSIGTMATTQIAADYGISAKKLNRILRDEGIQRKVGDQWILYAEHMNKGYTKSETISIVRSDGRPDTKLFTKWTQKGRLMINAVLNRRGIYANQDVIGLAA
jgi:prophage antirepressor-like protein